MSFARPLLAGAVVLASFAGAPAADAACYGSQSLALVCYTSRLPKVDPSGSSFDDCIVVSSQCRVPYSIPIPSVTPGGNPPVTVTCTGTLCN